MRFLVILIALVIIVVAAKRLWHRPRSPEKRKLRSDHMVQCASCGMYIPEQEALQHGERYYCSQAHLDEDKVSRP